MSAGLEPRSPHLEPPSIDLTGRGLLDDVRGQFASTFHERDDAPGVLVLSGELCRITRRRLAAALHAALTLEPHGLVVDVAAVTFVDAGSVWELVATSEVLRDGGWNLRIRGASPMFRRILEILDLLDLLDLLDPGSSELAGAPEIPQADRSRALGAALRRVTAELGLARVEARSALERHAQRSGLSLDQVAARIADGSLPCSAMTVITTAERPTIETDQITRRLEREYIVLRAGPRLDGAAAVELERELLATTPNADVVIDLHECEHATPDGIEAVLHLLDVLAANDSTLTVRGELTPALRHALDDHDALERLRIRPEAAPRVRRRGSADPKRR